MAPGRVAARYSFLLSIPADSDLSGYLLFFKVGGIEAGFSAPGTELKVIRDLEMIELWRD